MCLGTDEIVVECICGSDGVQIGCGWSADRGADRMGSGTVGERMRRACGEDYCAIDCDLIANGVWLVRVGYESVSIVRVKSTKGYYPIFLKFLIFGFQLMTAFYLKNIQGLTKFVCSYMALKSHNL